MHRKQFLSHTFPSLCIVMLTSFLISHPAAKADTDSIPYEFSMGISSYSGTYSGEVLDGFPNGQGSVTLADGTIFQGTFQNGLFDGSVRETSPDSSYYVYKCSDGKPYGKRKHYSKSAKLLDVDWYYNQRTISELTSLCAVADYRELLSDPNSYTQQLFQITGTVEMVFDDASSTYLLVQDQSGVRSICEYKNTLLNSNNQAWVPNLVVGDEVKLYGIFLYSDHFDSTSLVSSVPGFSENQNFLRQLLNGTQSQVSLQSNDIFTADDVFSNTLPYFSLFYGELLSDKDAFDFHASLTYDLLSRFPYYYSLEAYASTGTVCAISIDYAAGSVSMIVKEDSSQKFIYGTYSYGDKDYFPMIGDQITFKAQIKGNKKINYVDESSGQACYLLIPYLHLYKCLEK